MAALKGFIQIIGNPGKITRVLQQGKQRKENSHGRQHHRDNPGQDPVDSQNQQTVKPWGSAHSHEGFCELVLEAEQGVRQHLGGVIGACDGQPEYHGQHSDHDGITCETAGQNLIQLPVTFIVSVFVELDRITAYFLCRCNQGSHDAVL